MIGLLLIVALASTTTDAAHAQTEPASGTEWWYVLRGRANMKIGNYKAAIEAYGMAADLNPDNAEALKTLGIANERQGLTAKAIEHFDLYLDKFPGDPEIAFKQADYLRWERYAYRRNDAIRYYRMGLARQEDLERRHRLAQLLAQERAQLDEALTEYRILLAAKPDQATWQNEYRELLLWDESHLAEAIREYRRLEVQKPDDIEVSLTLARLIARAKPRSDEAATRYEDLVARRPRDTELRLVFADLIASQPSRRDRALEEYRLLLEQAPKPTTRESLADLLAAHPNDRTRAIAEYETLLSAEPSNVRVRLKYARLLGNRRQDVDAAIGAYQRVLVQQPDNSEAHAGLARSYSWKGDQDAALHHSNLSVRYGAPGRGLTDLRQELLRGREPRVTPSVRALVQEGGSKTELRGLSLATQGRIDATPFLTLQLDAGFEDYWRSGNNEAAGFFELDAEYRLDPDRQIELGVGYHSLADGGANVLARFAYSSTCEQWTCRAGYERKLRFDSFSALVGEKVAGQNIGAARENRFYTRFDTKRGRLSGIIEPYVGWVDARGISSNPFVGAKGRLQWQLFEIGPVEVSPYYRGDLYHYRDDAFGIDPTQGDPRAGGYFSPQLFFEQIPGLAFDASWGENQFLELEGGPSFQLVEESGSNTRFEIGGHARLAYVAFLNESLFWTLEADFTRIGDAYTRVGLNTSLTLKF